MTIEELEDLGHHAYLDDLKDVTFEDVSMTDGVVIQIVHQQQVLLEHRYYPDPSGQVHLDLRELVRNRTSFVLPNNSLDYTPQNDSGIYLTVKQGNSEYGFFAFGFREGLRQQLSRIDYLRVPQNFKLLVSLPNLSNILQDGDVDTSVKFIDHVRTRQLEDLPIGEADGYILVKEYPMADVQPALHMPFQLEFSFPDVPLSVQSKLTTPVYEVCPGSFEQYAFITETGTIENIPMDGNLKYIPEMAYENVRHSEVMLQASCSRDDIWEQNSGWLTLKAADALLRLLTSSDIYKLENGQWEKILIESSSVSVSTRNSLRSVTFAWRHVETD